jgi:RimJ/RimL family protein N-acetyltransferase
MKKDKIKYDINIISATNDMAEIFGKVHNLSWRQAYKDVMPLDYIERTTEEQRKDSFIKSLEDSNNYFFIVKCKDNPIGILHLSKRQDLITNVVEGEIVSIYMLEEYCGKGYGGIVLDFAIKYLENDSCIKIFLWVLEFNNRAKKVYEKYGFVFNGSQREIFRGEMYKQLKYEFS